MDNLAQEAIKAKNALNQLSHSQLKDRDAKNIVMQSESNLTEELDKFVSELEEVELSIEIAKSAIETHRSLIRKSEEIKERMISKVIAIMDANSLPSIKSDHFTFSLKTTPPKVIGDDVTKLDKRFIRAKFEADKDAIKKALQGGEFIEGWSLSNGGLTLQIKGR